MTGVDAHLVAPARVSTSGKLSAVARTRTSACPGAGTGSATSGTPMVEAAPSRSHRCAQPQAPFPAVATTPRSTNSPTSPSAKPHSRRTARLSAPGAVGVLPIWPGVREKRGAGAGCVTPKAFSNVPRAARCAPVGASARSSTDLPRVPLRHGRRGARTGTGAHRDRGVPRRAIRLPTPTGGPSIPRPQTMDRHGGGRPLRRDGTAGTARPRHPRVLRRPVNLPTIIEEPPP
jgi:hypothetical protein